MKHLTPLLLLTSICALAVGCGFTDPDYQQYSGSDASTETNSGGEEGTEAEGGEQTCEDKVIAAFGLVQSAIDNTCGNAGCHGDGSGGGLTLTPGDSSASQAALAAFVKGDASKLVTKLSDGGSHTGGVQIPGTLSESAVTTWLSAKDCEG